MLPKTILISGCSTGIGRDAALALSKRGHLVIASCRKSKDVDQLISQGIETVLMDVSSPESIEKAFSDVLMKTNGKLDVLINNAGYGQAGALEDVSFQHLYQQFATNVFGLMELTRKAIPVMRHQMQGRIINISSLLGMVSLPFRGAYNASKYAVEGISDTLRLELKPSGIRVITVIPGPILSRFRDNVIDSSMKNIDIEQSHFKTQYKQMLSGFRQQKQNSIFTQKTDAVIKKLIHAIESPSPNEKYYVTLPAHFFNLMKRLLTQKALSRLLSYVSKKEIDSSPL